MREAQRRFAGRVGVDRGPRHVWTSRDKRRVAALAASPAVALALSMSGPVARAADATWSVDAAGNWVDDSNWLPAAAPGSTAVTNNPDTATFGTIITAARTVTVDANRNLLGINFAGNSSAYTLSGGNLLLTNGGQIQTSGGGSAHTDTISSPIAVQGDGGAATFTAGSTTATRLLSLGAITGVSTGTNTTTLTFTGTGTGNNSVTGVIGNGAGGGTVAVSKTGTGFWRFQGANTYTGATSVTGGSLSVQNAAALGTTAAGTTVTGTANGANLQLSGPITVTGEALTISGDGAGATTGVFRNVSGNNTWTGNVTVLAASTTRVNSDANLLTISGNVALSPTTTDQFVLQGAGNGAISGVISGVSRVTKGTNGGGTWTLSGANTYTGKTTVTAGTLSVASLNSVSGGTASSNLGAPTTVADGTIDLSGNNTTGNLTYTGTGETTDRVINIAGTSGGGGIITQSGTGLLRFTSAFTATGSGTKALTLQGATAGTGEIAGPIVNGGATVSLTKAGTGMWTLSAANTYTGGTTVSAGTLRVTGSGTLGPTTTGGAVAVADAGLLDLQVPGLPDFAPLNVASTDATAEVSLGFSGTDSIVALTLNSTSLPAGVYGSTASGASGNSNITGAGLNPDDFFTGPGTVTVLPEPAGCIGTGLAFVGLLTRRRRRGA